MGIINFHIFDGSGNCLFSLNPPDQPDTMKILYGFLYSLKSFTQRISPMLLRDNNYFTYSTSHYHVVFYEFPTSLKFVLLVSSDIRKDSDFYRELLTRLYRNVYVEYHVKNPVKTDTAVESILFRNQLNTFLSSFSS